MKKLNSNPSHLSSSDLTRGSTRVQALHASGYPIRSGMTAVVLACLLWTIPVYATEWNATNCTNRGGTVATAVNGDTFCYSSQMMNVWSAHVWCQKHGGRLASYEKACALTALNNEAPCENFVGKAMPGAFWLSDYSKGKYCHVYAPNKKAYCNTGPFVRAADPFVAFCE